MLVTGFEETSEDRVKKLKSNVEMEKKAVFCKADPAGKKNYGQDQQSGKSHESFPGETRKGAIQYGAVRHLVGRSAQSKLSMTQHDQ